MESLHTPNYLLTACGFLARTSSYYGYSRGKYRSLPDLFIMFGSVLHGCETAIGIYIASLFLNDWKLYCLTVLDGMISLFRDHVDNIEHN